MTHPDATRKWTPPAGALWAWLVFLLAAMIIFLPMFTGQFLAGDDQVLAGYGFREFGAAFFRAHHHIPQWNPFLFGGMPFFGVIGHGDIFYPTAWLRWLVPTGLGMNLGFFIHVVLAGGTMYALLRTLKLSWTSALVGGLAYEMSGIVLSQISPGHDGKLFVSALAPLALMALVRAIRERRTGYYGWFAVVVGLAILTPQVQMAYYLMVACGLWTLWLVFLDGQRPRDRSPIIPLGMSLLAVILGLGIASIQLLPIFAYIPFTPRGEGGASGGWAYAISYSFHIKELPTVILPEFNGVLGHYWGQNALKLHTEYLGAIVAILAFIGIGKAKRRGILAGLAAIAILFLLVSLGGDTPFYRAWYEIMPNMKNVRAAGMAFYLVALPVAVWAACGVEALLDDEVSMRWLRWPVAVAGVVALLGVIGVLQSVAEALADPQARAVVLANADSLRMGSVRLLIVVLIGGAALFAVRGGKLRGAATAAVLALVVFGDLWSELRLFAHWLPPAAVTFASDQIIDEMHQTPLPFRDFDPAGGMAGAALYRGSVLMGHDVPVVFGYQGMESRFYDEIWGGKGIWQNQLSPSLHDLWAVRYLTLNQPVDSVPGFHPLAGPVMLSNTVNRNADQGYLWESDSARTWVRVVPEALLIPESQIAPTIIRSGYPTNLVALYPDTSSIAGATSQPSLPPPSALTATLKHWEPGAMTVAIDGSVADTSYLLVAENWYPDWKAEIDGKAAATHRADGAMLSVALPPGAKVVKLRFDMESYHRGKLLMIISLVIAAGLIGTGLVSRRAVAPTEGGDDG